MWPQIVLDRPTLYGINQSNQNQRSIAVSPPVSASTKPSCLHAVFQIRWLGDQFAPISTVYRFGNGIIHHILIGDGPRRTGWIWMSMSAVLVMLSGSWLYQTSLDIPCSAARCGDSELHAVFPEVFLLRAQCVVSRNDLGEAPGAWDCQIGFGRRDVNLVQPSTRQYHQHRRHRIGLVFKVLHLLECGV